jgi:hypothetical protein
MYHDLEQRTMGGVIRYAAKCWPDRTAIHWEDKKITFKYEVTIHPGVPTMNVYS